MAQVTLRDKLSGTRAKFFLDSEGRVVVDRVLLALGASLVKLDDDDGGFSVLEPNHNGKSLNVFKPGQVVAVDVIPQQPQVGPSLEQRTSLLDRLVMDADDPTMYLDCEYVHAIDLRVHVSTRVYTWNEFKSGELTTRGDPQIALVGYPPPSFVGSSHDHGWDEVYKGSKHKVHMEHIDSWLGLPPDTGFNWLSEGSKAGVKRVFDNTVSVGSKNNEVLSDLSGGVESAVLGVNIYKRLTWPAILRTHLEYLLWAVTSWLPYMQLLTDMKTGGLFYACNGELDGCSVIWIVVMQDMKQVKEAFEHFGKSLPKSVNDFRLEEHFQFKTLPHRAKFPYKGAQHPAVRAV